MILLAKEADRFPFPPFGPMDIDVARNAYGRQVFSFNEEIEWRPGAPSGNGNEPAKAEAPGDSQGLLKAIFIRSLHPRRMGEGVEVLAELRGEPVTICQGTLVALSFPPELMGDTRVHRWFVGEFFGPRD